MILSFDKFERYELPQVTLCNPNSRATEVDGKITITDTVGVLSNPKGMNLKLNFNAPHELSFDYYRHKSNDPIKQSFYDSIYEAIQTDRYIYLTDIGYFVISSVTDSDEDNIDKKSITLKSCEENEFATAEGLYLKEGTYYLHTENNDGLLDLFLPKTAGWTMDYIDPSLLTKPYFVEETEVDNGYNFLYTTIQDMFECIVEPDIIRRTISVYSRVYYAEHHLTDIHIAKYNLLKHKTVEENDEDKYTALNVQGKDENLEIRIVNPTGKNVIYNFESRYSWMSPALQDAVERWQDKCESVEDEYLTLQQGYYDDMGNIVFPLEKDIETLELQLKEQEQTRDFIVRDDYDKKKYGEVQKDALDAINREIKTTQSQLKSKKEDLEVEKKNVQNNYLQHIDQINLDCALDVTAIDINGNSIFTTDLLNELMTHIKPTDYVDEYMLVTESMTYPQRFEKAKELMDRAQSQLVKISSGQKTYSIDTRSFLFNKQFKHFSEQLCPGAIIYTETKNDIMEQLHLTGIDINFDEKSAGLILGNKYDRSDLKALYDEALGQNSKSFSELKYIASIIEDQQKQLDYQRNWVADLRTLTLDNVLTSEDQAFEINNRGLIGRKRQLNEDGSWKTDENGNPLFDAEQVKLINNTLVFTDKNWQNATTAVGKIAVGYDANGNVKYAYGINGQVLIGELILGNNLVLTGTGAGIKITDSNGNKVFYADDNGNLVLNGRIEAKSGTIGGWTIGDTKISADNGTTHISSSRIDSWAFYSAGTNGTFKVGFDGDMYCDSATIKGHIEADTGNIGGWQINGTKISANNGNAYISSSGDGWAFYSSGSNGTFRVGFWGDMYCDSATIKGHIEASSGSIANWTMSGDCLYTGDILSGGTGVLIKRPTKVGPWGADTDVIICRINGTDNFRLNSDGSLLATRADIRGTITATSGSIGGWSIDGQHIYNTNPTTGYTFSLWNPAIAGGTIISCHNGSDCPFYVNRDGFLKATSADIRGTITATSGSFGVWNIGKSSYGGENAMIANDGYNYTSISPSGVYYVNRDGDGDMFRTWGQILVSASDKRLKNSIEYIVSHNNLEAFFNSLKPCTYYYKNGYALGDTSKLHIGFIAQDIQESVNNFDIQKFSGLSENFREDYFGLNYQEFIALNTWQIQKLKKRASADETRIMNLEATVAELKAQLQTLTAG